MFAKSLLTTTVVTLAVLVFAAVNVPGISYAGDTCGKGETATKTAIDIGCKGAGNSIADMLFAIIRILSDGVGLVVVASIAYAGVQYTASQGNSQETAKAVQRIRSSIFALLLFIFGYAILNYLIPGTFLN